MRFHLVVLSVLNTLKRVGLIPAMARFITLCGKLYQLLVSGYYTVFCYVCLRVSLTNKTECHELAEICFGWSWDSTNSLTLLRMCVCPYSVPEFPMSYTCRGDVFMFNVLWWEGSVRLVAFLDLFIRLFHYWIWHYNPWSLLIYFRRNWLKDCYMRNNYII